MPLLGKEFSRPVDDLDENRCCFTSGIGSSSAGFSGRLRHLCRLLGGDNKGSLLLSQFEKLLTRLLLGNTLGVALRFENLDPCDVAKQRQQEKDSVFRKGVDP